MADNGNSLSPKDPDIDGELLSRYQQGDFNAFDRFYRKNHSIIYKFFLSRIGNRTEAEEAFQDTFLRLHRSIMTYDPAQRALPWVFAIATNVLIDRSKKRSKIKFEELERSCDPSFEASFMAREELQTILAGLSEEERELLERRLLGNEAFDDIAKSKSLTNASVRQRFSRLMRKVGTRRSPQMNQA
ncbi:MAG: RNA polymerase sigma factor [Oligoflexales bacterium]